MSFSLWKGVAETIQPTASADIFNIRMYLKQETHSVERGYVQLLKFCDKLLPRKKTH